MSLQDGDSATSGLSEQTKPRSSSAASSAPDTPVLTSRFVTSAEQDSFEDAVDNANGAGDETLDTRSVRSLTKRSISIPKSPSLKPELDGKDEGKDHGKDTKADSQDLGQEDGFLQHSRSESRPRSIQTSPPISNRISNTSDLDNVNLDDENPTETEGTVNVKMNLRNKEFDVAYVFIVPPSPPEKDVPSKTLSLGSITNVLPPMPWSPPADSPAKSPVPSVTATAPPTHQHQWPSTRKLTIPFSWLSRNSTSKDKDFAPPPIQPTGRRNTASSSTTMISNPELMLSKFDEEYEDLHSPSGSQREGLKDRFKALRMREEAGIELIPGEHDGQGDAILASPMSETPPADKNQQQTVLNTNHDLRPGTASGVNAGPSTMQESHVDWDLWQSVVYEGPAAVARTSPEELNTAIATGIPNAIRGVIWQVLARSKNEHLEILYKDLAARGTNQKKRNSGSTISSSASHERIAASTTRDSVKSSASSTHSNQSAANGSTSSRSEGSQDATLKAQMAVAAEKRKKQKEDAVAVQKLEKIIRRDLGARTSFSKYAAAAGLQDGLFGVCKAYALFDEGVGYAQGMNFLIMPLLFNMPEEEAFCLLVRLMHHYKLRDLFVQDMPGLHLHLYQFERLLEDLEPALYCHLHRRGISSHLYATQWFLTLFAYRFPLQLVLRIYDLILSEGLSAILRFGIALMQKNATTLLAISDMQQLTTYLKDKLFDVYIDKNPSQGSILENGFFGSSSSSMDKEVYRADQLVRDACEIKITPETLKAYTIEWEEKRKAEKDRETELQDLKLANQKFSVQLRKLEARVQACDAEQAALATELVHTKVENEELRDENEGLKGQVMELRLVIERQPVEIENSWKQERDDLMKRNEKVHEENQKVEKELADVEEQLVQTRLRYAEIDSRHEELKRKWADLKRQFT
ncbi:hypothetical protein E4U42_004613 [Claviceps africana]|uniref:GTPase-activating protein GYP5 n=1 Tax=Claviceps africana TaxID=83212 RepID=A0A8K0NGW7_9HYPO|nr:hypothetical protein E4U42_004613 [Claviceps africana]